MDIDIERGLNQELYSEMVESLSQFEWGFIKKVYFIIAIQLLVTVTVATIVAIYNPFRYFFTASHNAYIIIVIVPIFVFCLVCYYHRQHPYNCVLLGIFTISLGFVVGFTCLFASGKVILVSIIFTASVVVSLTLWTLWAAKRGYDFNFLGPFLFGALFVMIIFSLILIFFPLGG